MVLITYGNRGLNNLVNFLLSNIVVKANFFSGEGGVRLIAAASALLF